jgi:hypothetical protein
MDTSPERKIWVKRWNLDIIRAISCCTSVFIALYTVLEWTIGNKLGGFLFLMTFMALFPLSITVGVTAILKRDVQQQKEHPIAFLRNQLDEALTQKKKLAESPIETPEIASQKEQIGIVITELETAIAQCIAEETRPRIERLQAALPEIKAIKEVKSK